MFAPTFLLLHKKGQHFGKMLSFFYIHMGLSFHFPELYRVWLKLAAATKIMDSACKKLLCLTAACVKVSCERLIVSVYCNKDTLTLELTLDYTLLIGKNRYFDRAIAERPCCFCVASAILEISSVRSFHSGFSKLTRRAGSPSLLFAFVPHSEP